MRTNWFWLTKVANPMTLKKIPGGKALIKRELDNLNDMSKGEWITSIVFGLTALGWIFRPQLSVMLNEAGIIPSADYIKDATIAMAGALLLFIIPVNYKTGTFVMDWKSAEKLPWGVLLLFGGGLSMASGFKATKLADWIGSQVSMLNDVPMLITIVAVITLVMFLTELTSNTATTAMLMPILASVAIGLNQNPLLLLLPATIAASCAFMMPVATPPNAIVFGSGHVSIPQMMRSGLGLNLIGIILCTLLTYGVMVHVFDIKMDELPSWITYRDR